MNYSLRCALISVITYIAIILTAYFTHTQLSGIGAYSRLIALGLSVIPLYAGIKYKRDNIQDGYITTRQVMIAGVIISLQACVLAAIYTYIHYTYIDTDLIAQLSLETKRQGELQHKSAFEIEQKIKELTVFYAPFKQATAVLTGFLGTGTVFSFILSTFLVRNPTDTDK